MQFIYAKMMHVDIVISHVNKIKVEREHIYLAC